MDTPFLETRFLLLILFSFLLPTAIFSILIIKKMISKLTVALFGVLLVLLAGVDFILLQSLMSSAKGSLSSLAGKIFLSEVSIGLYLMPAVFAGIGINILSHLLITHLTEAEQKYEKIQSDT